MLFQNTSPSTDSSTAPPTAIVPPIPSSYVLQTVNPNICINSFSCPTDKFVTEILNLLRPHIEPFPNTDPFVILNHIFDTYVTLQSIQFLTLSTVHVNEFPNKLVLLQTPTFNVTS